MSDPKVFISYSHSSEEHKARVLRLAKDLIDNGVDVEIDLWGLREGQDVLEFMERMKKDQESKVIIVSDKKYTEKADNRKAGVGTETQIISPELYEDVNQKRIVAVVFEKDENGIPYLPIYCKSRKYIDMFDEENYIINLEQLVRWIYDKPYYVKPPLGKAPSYITETNAPHLGTSARFTIAINAIKNSRDFASGALSEYFEKLISGFENFRITDYEGEIDEEVLEKIEMFLPYRNEAIEIFIALAQYYNVRDIDFHLHEFFEKLIPYIDRPDTMQPWKSWDFDNYKFIIQELFLYCITALIKYERYDSVVYLLNKQYHIEREDVMINYTIFRHYLESFEHAERRLQLDPALHADKLKERNNDTGIDFELIMQTDFILYIRDWLDALKENRHAHWYPDTLYYKIRNRSAFSVFRKAESIEFFNRFKKVLNIEIKEDLVPLINLFTNESSFIPRWNFLFIHPIEMINYENLATKP